MNRCIVALVLPILCQGMRLNSFTKIETKGKGASSPSISAQHAALNVFPSLSSADASFKEWIEGTTEPVRFAQDLKSIGLSRQNPKGSIAVMTSGTLKRYQLESALRGLLAPLASEGYKVDYFLALGSADFAAWQPVGDKYEYEPIQKSKYPVIQKMINETVQKVGANLRHIDLFSSVELTEAAQQFVKKAPGWNGESPRNTLLKRMLKYQSLKEIMKKQEEKSKAYDWVIMVDDDALWIQPLKFQELLNFNSIYNYDNAGCGFGENTSPRAFNLMCQDGSTYPTPKCQLTDYVWVLDRKAAETYMSQYNLILNGNHDGQGKPSMQYWGQFNGEEFAGQIASENGINVLSVPAHLIPMQRAGRMRSKDGQKTTCLHKVCKSGPSHEFLNLVQSYQNCLDLE